MRSHANEKLVCRGHIKQKNMLRRRDSFITLPPWHGQRVQQKTTQTSSAKTLLNGSQLRTSLKIIILNYSIDNLTAAFQNCFRMENILLCSYYCVF